MKFLKKTMSNITIKRVCDTIARSQKPLFHIGPNFNQKYCLDVDIYAAAHNIPIIIPEHLSDWMNYTHVDSSFKETVKILDLSNPALLALNNADCIIFLGSPDPRIDNIIIHKITRYIDRQIKLTFDLDTMGHNSFFLDTIDNVYSPYQRDEWINEIMKWKYIYENL